MKELISIYITFSIFTIIPNMFIIYKFLKRKCKGKNKQFSDYYYKYELVSCLNYLFLFFNVIILFWSISKIIYILL